MEDRRYVVNRKVLAATRALDQSEGADKRWRYMYVSPQGAICTDTTMIAKVTLPPQLPNAPTAPQVFTEDMLLNIDAKLKTEELVTLPQGKEAKSNGEISIPSFTAAIPNPNTQVASITVTAKHLIKLLKAACEVTDHARQLVRVRIHGTDPKNMQLRIDAHRDEDGQEFCGVLMGTIYNGSCIPGDANGAPVTTSEAVDTAKLTLPLSEGRKFRD